MNTTQDYKIRKTHNGFIVSTLGHKREFLNITDKQQVMQKAEKWVEKVKTIYIFRESRNIQIDPKSEKVIVHLVSWKKANELLNKLIKEQHPEFESINFSLDESVKGYVIHEGKMILLSKEAILSVESNEHVKISVFANTSLDPVFSVNANVNTIFDSAIGKKITLPEYMGINYQYNDHAKTNEKYLLNILNLK